LNRKTLCFNPCDVPFDRVIDQLEPRTLLSAPYEFAAVGVRFDATNPAVFEMLGALAGDGSITGTQTFAQRTGSPVSGPIDFASMQLLSNGRLGSSPRSGVDPYESFLGSNFVSERGYPFGSFFGQFANDGPTDIAFLLQRPEDRTVDWESIDRIQFQYLEFSDTGFSIHAGQFYVNSSNTVVWSDSADGSNSFQVAVTSQDEFGSLHLSNGRNVHANPWAFSNTGGESYPSGSVVLIVDTDNSDGKIGFGIAQKADDFAHIGSANGLHGVYRTSILTDGPLAEQFFGAQPLTGGVSSARIALELSITGRYAIYDLAAYDAGGRTALSAGDWEATTDFIASRADFVILTADSNDARAYFNISADYVLVPYFVTNDNGASVEQMTGGAVTFSPAAIDRNIQGGHVGLDGNGHPIFYLTAVEDFLAEVDVANWYSEDLVELWGGKSLVAVDSIERSDQFYQVVGVATDGDVLMWERYFNGRWIFRNVTDELGASGIVSDIIIFQHSGIDGSFFATAYQALAVAGKNADGDLILYTPLLQPDEYGVHPWTALNVSEDGLEPAGQPTPEWTGGVQGYQTSWGGLNIVGIDAAGDLVVAWTAPGLAHWFTTNVSDLANSPALAGSISVIMTSWNGIHIHALDAQGDLHSTWWVPQFEGFWAHNNLTDELAGPPLDISRNTDRTEAFTTFIGVGNTLNIVGFDANGRVKVYWWSPETNVWLVGDITDSFPPSEAPLGFASADFLGATDPNGPLSQTGQSLYGYNADGSFSRVWWAPFGADLWHVENLTQQAIPIES
jgi:hypothetical protein